MDGQRQLRACERSRTSKISAHSKASNLLHRDLRWNDLGIVNPRCDAARCKMPGERRTVAVEYLQRKEMPAGVRTWIRNPEARMVDLLLVSASDLRTAPCPLC